MIIHIAYHIPALRFLLLMLLTAGAIRAGGDQENRCFIHTIAEPVYDDVRAVVSSPARLTKTDVLRLSAFTLITAGFIYRYDRQIDEAFYRDTGKSGYENGLLVLGKNFAKIGNIYNEVRPVYFLTGLTSAILLSGVIAHDTKLVDTARLMSESFLITGAFTTLSKGLFGRSRPFLEKGPHDFHFFEFRMRNRFLSMPSGHSSSIFSVMTVIANQYPHWWIRLPAYTFCVSVALQRIDTHQHWASDVIIGGAIGYWVGKTLVNKHKNSSNKSSVYPAASPDQVGIKLYF